MRTILTEQEALEIIRNNPEILRNHIKVSGEIQIERTDGKTIPVPKNCCQNQNIPSNRFGIKNVFILENLLDDVDSEEGHNLVKVLQKYSYSGYFKICQKCDMVGYKKDFKWIKGGILNPVTPFKLLIKNLKNNSFDHLLLEEKETPPIITKTKEPSSSELLFKKLAALPVQSILNIFDSCGINDLDFGKSHSRKKAIEGMKNDPNFLRDWYKYAHACFFITIEKNWNPSKIEKNPVISSKNLCAHLKNDSKKEISKFLTNAGITKNDYVRSKDYIVDTIKCNNHYELERENVTKPSFWKKIRNWKP